MQPGLAKEAPQDQPIPVPVQAKEPPQSTSNYEWQGIPIDMFRQFQTDIGTLPTKDVEKLRDISQWAKGKVGPDGTLGDMLQKVSEIQRRLGAPNAGERAYHKVWEFIKLQRVADEAIKRQEAMMPHRWI